MSENNHFCPYCGHEVLTGDVFCGTCGKRLNEDDLSTSSSEPDVHTSIPDTEIKPIENFVKPSQLVSNQQSFTQEEVITNKDFSEKTSPSIENITFEEAHNASNSLTNCPNCNQLIEKDSNFCKNCSHKLEKPDTNDIKEEQESSGENNNLVHCPECGKLISKKATACPNCGHPFPQNKEQNVTQNANNSSGIGFGGVVLAVIVAILILSFF